MKDHPRLESRYCLKVAVAVTGKKPQTIRRGMRRMGLEPTAKGYAAYIRTVRWKVRLNPR